MENKKNIEVIPGDGNDLNISPVYEHLNAGKPKNEKKPTHVVVPQEKNKNNSKK